MSKPGIVIVDYGMGNIYSVKKKLSNLKTGCTISSDPEDVISAEKIILPGVGHFRNAVENLEKLNLVDALETAVMKNKVPVLGICLGLQLFARFSYEGNVEGFGWLDAEVIRFSVNDNLKYKIPHIGWNSISITKNSQLMRDIPPSSEFYFVHSYHLVTNDKAIILNETVYEYNFISAIEKDNIFGVQYHPEKSHDTGEKLLRNFINI